MARSKLTISRMISSAADFCEVERSRKRKELYGVTDGKAIGTIVEHDFKDFLEARYDMELGNSASGLDLPSIDCDIKVTSLAQPQSSCPYRDSKQKIYGLGYNLIVFVYQKHDYPTTRTGRLDIVSCSYIDKSRTADFQTTRGIIEIINNDGNADDIFAFLSDRNIPADEVSLMQMARELLKNPPQLGYLTISNALQWRLQYGRIVHLDENVRGITKIVSYGE